MNSLDPTMLEDILPDSEDEKEGSEKEAGDPLAARLLKTRTILLSDEIDIKLAHKIITQLLLLEQEDPKAPIHIFIDSPGGDADAGFAMHDMIRFIKPSVKCVCAGITASAAVIVLLASAKEDRLSMPNARVLIHQPSMAIRGHASDIDIEASQILKIRDRINQLIAEETGQPVERIEQDTKRNFWMSAEEAKAYGLVSRIVARRDELKKG